MRLVAFCLIVALITPVQAADKDEEKAKVVVGEFLKAFAAKDVDGMMKTVDLPFMTEFGTAMPEIIDKADVLKKATAEHLDHLGKVNLERIKSLKVGKVYDVAGVAKYAKDNLNEDEAKRFIEQAEKHVGKSGYVVMLVRDEGKEVGVLVRFRDGKAFVAGIPK